MKIKQITEVAHEANRAYCKTIGDASQLPWKDAPEWQRESSITQVEFHLNNPRAGVSVSHDSWMQEKQSTGWKHGPVKDSVKREHPCIMPFDELPWEEQAKDYLFSSVVKALGRFYRSVG